MEPGASQIRGDRMPKLRIPLSSLTRMGTLVLLSSSAFADSPTDWTGFYVGAHAGYVAGDADFSVNPTGAWNAFPDQAAAVRAATNGSLNPDGGIFGLQSGFNHQLGIWVVGLEADVSGVDLSESRAGGPIPPSGVTSFSQQAELSWMATLRERLGVTAGPALFFATAGAAFGEWDVFMRMAGGPDAAVFSNSTVQTGWVAGGGVEYAFTERLSLKGEYLFADFGNVEGQSAFFPTAPAFVNEHNIDLSAQVARAGINYRF